MTRRLPRVIAVFAALSLLAVGCGGDDDDDGTAAGGSASGELDLPETCETEQGVEDDTIRITVITDLSGPISSVGGIIHADAFNAHFDAINDEGGIDGRQVQVDIQDGEYDPATAAQHYEEVRLDTAMVPDILGSAMIEAVAAEMEEDCLITFQGANNGQLAQRYRSVFTPSPSAGHDVVSGVAWALEETPEATFAVAYQSDAFGEALKAAADFASSESGFDYEEEVTFGPRDTDLTAQTQALLSADPDYVIYGGLPTQLAAMSAGVHAAGNDMKFLVPTGGWSSALLGTPAREALEANVIFISPYANWDSDAPGVVRMRDELEEYAPDLQPGAAVQTGYIAAVVTGEVLQKAAEEGDLSLGGIYQAAATLDFDAEGLIPPSRYGQFEDEPRIPGHETGVFQPDSSREGGVAPLTDGFVLFELSEQYVEPA